MLSNKAAQLRSARGARGGLFVPVVPVDVVELADISAPALAAELVPLPDMERAWSAAEGAVRTTEPVSLRGTAFCVASAAVCGVVPMAAGACVVAGAVLFGVWATLLKAANKTAPANTDFAKKMLFISTSSSIDKYKGIDKNTFI